MAQAPTNYENLRKIVAATDYSPLSDLALNAAIEDAFRSEGLLHILHVTDPGGAAAGARGGPGYGRVDDAFEQLRRHAAARLLSHAELHRLPGPVSGICHIRAGDPGREIAQAAVDLEADVVYVSTHGRTGFRRMVLGSVAERVTRFAPCPVMVMRVKVQKADEWMRPAGPTVATIAPPCTDCVAVRRQSDGAEFWCAAHQNNLGRRHVGHHVSRSGQEVVNMPLVFNQQR